MMYCVYVHTYTVYCTCLVAARSASLHNFNEGGGEIVTVLRQEYPRAHLQTPSSGPQRTCDENELWKRVLHEPFPRLWHWCKPGIPLLT